MFDEIKIIINYFKYKPKLFGINHPLEGLHKKPGLYFKLLPYFIYPHIPSGKFTDF